VAGWCATGFGTWISLRLLGHHTDIVGVLALEAAVCTWIASGLVRRRLIK